MTSMSFAIKPCTLGGKPGACGGVESARARSRGAEGSSEAPLEVGALAQWGGMIVFVTVASHLSIRTPTDMDLSLVGDLT